MWFPKNLKLTFSCIVTLLYVKYAASLQYVPPSREVDVVQAGSYQIGIEDDIELEITRCHFTGDTGLNCTFEIWPVRSNGNRNPIYCNYNGEFYEFQNTVTEHGREGLCQITVAMVQDTGPTNWTLIAEDFDDRVVVNNTFKVNFFYKADLLEYEIRVLEFSNFVNHMTGFAFDELINCNVKFNDTIIELDLHSTRVSTYLASYTEPIQEVTERLSSLGVGLCGFKYLNATNTIRHLHWTLTTTTKRGLKYRASFSTRIDPKPTPGIMHTRSVVFWGTEVVVPCGPSPAARYLCSIFNPRGELVESQDCQFTITSFSMNEVGLWKCYVGSLTTMESLEYTVELVGKNAETIDIWNYESETYLSMGCKTVNVGASIQYCKMIAPNNRIFILQPHIATDRYLSLGTKVNEGICSLQIKKPLQEYEKGRWVCEIGISYRDPTGSAIVVGDPPGDLNYPKYRKITTQLHESVKIICEVPYFTEYCRIRAPNGTKYHSDSEGQIRLGKCMMTIKDVGTSENGTWVCQYGRKTGEPDDEIFVEITVAEVLQYYKFVEVDAEDSAEIICSSGGLPLRYCRFVAPDGRGYQIHNHMNSSTLSYYGRGLEYGDCGIKISRTKKATDSGYWTCQTELISAQKHLEISARILLDVTDISPNFAAIGIGTAVSVALVGAIIGMLVLRKWRRRRHQEFPGVTTTERGINTDDSLSEDSGSNIFNMSTVLQAYSQESRQESPEQEQAL